MRSAVSTVMRPAPHNSLGCNNRGITDSSLLLLRDGFRAAVNQTSAPVFPSRPAPFPGTFELFVET